MIQRIHAFVAFVACCSCAAAADPDRRAGVDFNKPIALSEAVAQFNAQVASISDVGRSQPSLTVDEIVAAIRAWDTEAFPVEPELYAIFSRIANTRMLPAGSQIDFTTRWNPGRGYRYTVWWVDLSVSAPNPAKKDSRIGYTYRIRDRKLSSRLSGEPVRTPFQVIKDAERQRHIAGYLSKAFSEADD